MMESRERIPTSLSLAVQLGQLQLPYFCMLNCWKTALVFSGDVTV